MAEFLTIEDFAAHLNTAFRVDVPGDLDLEMVEVQDGSNERIEQFSVLFTGPASPCLRQGTYTLKHPQLLELAIFLVALGPKNARMVYVATFSRLIAATQPVG
jgi:Domain of unknown function (DUF6916)